MNAADKLRELLATRPEIPNTEQLFSWWQTSGELLDELLNQPAPATPLDELAESLVVSSHALKSRPFSVTASSIGGVVERSNDLIHQLAVVLADTRDMVRSVVPGPDGRARRRG